MADEQVKLTPHPSTLSEDQIKELPSFEEYTWGMIAHQMKLVDPENEPNPNMDPLLNSLGCHLAVRKNALQKRVRKTCGMLEEDSELLGKELQAWWGDYYKLQLIRTFIIQYYDVPSPDIEKLLPNRYDIGVILSKETLQKLVEKKNVQKDEKGTVTLNDLVTSDQEWANLMREQAKKVKGVQVQEPVNPQHEHEEEIHRMRTQREAIAEEESEEDETEKEETPESD